MRALSGAPSNAAGASPSDTQSAGGRLFGGYGSSETDPAEPWEIPVPEQDPKNLNPWLFGRSFRPITPDYLPPSALPSLQAVCGPLPFERLYAIPRTTRIAAHGQCVVTPTMVLGFGDETVSLWVDYGAYGFTMSLPVDRLLAIDEQKILLHGRLGLVAAGAQLVVRYNTVTRNDLLENLADLRKRIAATPRPVDPCFLWLDAHQGGLSPADLPHKWRTVLDYPCVRPDPSESVRIAVGDVSETPEGHVFGRHTRPPSGIAVLGSRELVIANEPMAYEDDARHGVDFLTVPIDHLDSLGWDGRSLTVRLVRDGAEGRETASLVRPLDPYLVEAMWRAFGSAVRWV